MSVDLNVLEHLGINLYSSIPPVLSEVVANSYDADATTVKIQIDKENGIIEIQDNGCGMTLSDINEKYLKVGYRKRCEEGGTSIKFQRPVMGRKGIGKLSLFSIADEIEIHTKSVDSQGEAFVIVKENLERCIREGENAFSPDEVAFNPETIDCTVGSGTYIKLSKLKNGVTRTEAYLRKNISRRFFFVPNPQAPFNIVINNEPVSFEDRGYINKIKYVWIIGDYQGDWLRNSHIIETSNLSGEINNGQFRINGWIGSVARPSDLKQDDTVNNKISIIVRGKLAQEDVLSNFSDGGLYASYLVGEICADFLDDDDLPDIATSNRQQIIETDARFEALQALIQRHLKHIQGEWSEFRKKENLETALRDIPELSGWLNGLRGDSRKQAEKIFQIIENATTHNGDIEKRRSLYGYGILAFERLRVTENLSAIEHLSSADKLVSFGEVFSNMQDVEAALYYDIASQRVEVLRKLTSQCDDNQKERILQEQIFNHLWLLDSSWERATDGTAKFEKGLTEEFDGVTETLTSDEKKARIDIRYKNIAGKHIIIELKRYKMTYSYDIDDATRQIRKYKKALQKCLDNNDPGKEHLIETILIVGPDAFKDIDYKEVERSLAAVDARMVTYDQLIRSAEESYGAYLHANKEASKITELVNRIIGGTSNN